MKSSLRAPVLLTALALGTAFADSRAADDPYAAAFAASGKKKKPLSRA